MPFAATGAVQGRVHCTLQSNLPRDTRSERQPTYVLIAQRYLFDMKSAVSYKA
jgi:hypothetical protein